MNPFGVKRRSKDATSTVRKGTRITSSQAKACAPPFSGGKEVTAERNCVIADHRTQGARRRQRAGGQPCHCVNEEEHGVRGDRTLGPPAEPNPPGVAVGTGRTKCQLMSEECQRQGEREHEELGTREKRE